MSYRLVDLAAISNARFLQWTLYFSAQHTAVVRQPHAAWVAGAHVCGKAVDCPADFYTLKSS